MITAMGKVGLVASSSSLTDKNNTTRQLGQKQQPLPSLFSSKKTKIQIRKKYYDWFNQGISLQFFYLGMLHPKPNFPDSLTLNLTGTQPISVSWDCRTVLKRKWWLALEAWKAAAVAVYNNTTCTNANFFSHSLLRKECLRPNLLDFETF